MKKRAGSISKWIMAVLLVLALGTAGLVVVSAKNRRVRVRFLSFLTDKAAKSYGLRVVIKDFDGDLFGTLALKEINVTVPQDEGEDLSIFSADEVRFRYKLIDILRENFSGWFDIILKRPVFVSQVPFGESVPQARSLEFFSGVTQRVQRNARLLIEDGTIQWLGKEGVLSGIEGRIENHAFDLKISVDHVKIGMFDTTTTILFNGEVALDRKSSEAYLKGSIRTQGTVINWKPLPDETSVNFEIRKDRLLIADGAMLGGMRVSGVIGHSKKRDVDLIFSFEDYYFSKVHDIFSFKGKAPLDGVLNGSVKVTGSAMQPRLVGALSVQNNNPAANSYRNLQMNFQGIYPEVRLDESRMVLPDGNTMRFSNHLVHIRELLDSSTYERLISYTEQTTVAWGDWTLIRQEDRDSVSFEKNLAEKMSVKYKMNGDDPTRMETGFAENEVGMEYLLDGSGSLTVEVGEDEQFFGLQKKKAF